MAGGESAARREKGERELAQGDAVLTLSPMGWTATARRGQGCRESTGERLVRGGMSMTNSSIPDHPGSIPWPERTMRMRWSERWPSTDLARTDTTAASSNPTAARRSSGRGKESLDPEFAGGKRGEGGRRASRAPYAARGARRRRGQHGHGGSWCGGDGRSARRQ